LLRADVQLQQAGPREALLRVAECCHLDLLAVNLPDQKADFSVQQSPVDQALRHLASVYSLQCARWRNLLLAAPLPSPRSYRERLRAALPAEVAELLLRGADDGTVHAPGWECLLEAIRVFYRHQEKEAQGQAAVQRAAYWIAAPELDELLHLLETWEAGRLLIQVRPHAPEVDDPCTEHLWIMAPRPSARSHTPRVFVWFHSPAWDPFALLWERIRPAIPLEEYRQQEIALCRHRENPFPEDERLDGTLELAGDDLAWPNFLAQFKAVVDFPLTETETVLPAPTQWTVRLSQTTARDALLAVAYLRGCAVVREGPSYRLDAPQVPLEQVIPVLPLALWAKSQLSTDERRLLCMDNERAFWETIQGDQAMLRERACSWQELPRAAHGLVSELLESHGAYRFQNWLCNLPTRDGTVPLEFSENTKNGHFILRSPGRIELVQGPTSGRLKMELTGQKALRQPREEQ
jgi:hypothetical protein